MKEEGPCVKREKDKGAKKALYYAESAFFQITTGELEDI